jgi:hypothetical protein
LCPKCGMPLEVCTSHADTGPQFGVRVVRCRATDARLAEMAGRKPDRPEALLVAVHAKEAAR